MPRRLHYTQDEWLALAQAPIAAALAVMGTGGPSPFQMARELLGLETALRETGQAATAGLLVRELYIETQAQLIERAQQQGATIDMTSLRDQALELARRVAAIVDAKEPAADAAEYKRWTVWIARRVAASASEDGARPISDEEAALLADLVAALGIAPGQPAATDAPLPSAEEPGGAARSVGDDRGAAGER